MKIAYSGKSRLSALKMKDIDDKVELVRNSTEETIVNWGRYRANAKLNPNISNVTNKRVMRELFKEHDVPMPRLIDKNELRLCLFRKPLVGRPDHHTKGRGFWKVDSVASLNRAVAGTRRKRAATHFMEFVESDREYRVHIFKGKSIRISEKIYTDGSKKEYTTGKPGEIKLAKVRKAAKLAVEAVGLDFGAVDILARGENNEEVFVLEVNAAPGLGGTMPKLYLETFENWKEENDG